MVVGWGLGATIESRQSNPPCRNRPGSVNARGRFGNRFFSGDLESEVVLSPGKL
jgi:hypothetical protein